jgi:hypothetical protein
MSIYPPEPWCIDCPPFNNPDCQPYCYDFPFQDMTEILCDIPCNYGGWHNGVLDDIELPFCLGCTLKIHYKWRETIDCEPNNYFDMKIEAPNPNDPTQHAIEFSGSGCDNCNQNDPAFNYKVYNFACNYVLKNGEIPKPDYQQSSVYYRVLNYHCWGIWFLEPPFGDGWIFEKCDLTKCCWAQFRITNSGNPDIGDVINVELIYGTTNEEGCHVYPHPCSTYCVEALTTIWGSNLSAVGSNTVNYINNNFKININPNPSTYDRILRIESDYLGEISFEVFNNLGELVSSEKLNKSSKIFERILKIDNLANGFYKACVIIKGKQIYCCKFIVIK